MRVFFGLPLFFQPSSLFFSFWCHFHVHIRRLLIGSWVFRDDVDDVSCSCCILDCTGLELTMDIDGFYYKKHEAM